MTKLKKAITLLTTFTLCLSFASCGRSAEEEKDDELAESRFEALQKEAEELDEYEKKYPGKIKADDSTIESIKRQNEEMREQQLEREAEEKERQRHPSSQNDQSDYYEDNSSQTEDLQYDEEYYKKLYGPYIVEDPFPGEDSTKYTYDIEEYQAITHSFNPCQKYKRVKRTYIDSACHDFECEGPKSGDIWEGLGVKFKVPEGMSAKVIAYGSYLGSNNTKKGELRLKTHNKYERYTGFTDPKFLDKKNKDEGNIVLHLDYFEKHPLKVGQKLAKDEIGYIKNKQWEKLTYFAGVDGYLVTEIKQVIKKGDYTIYYTAQPNSKNNTDYGEPSYVESYFGYNTKTKAIVGGQLKSNGKNSEKSKTFKKRFQTLLDSFELSDIDYVP